MIEEIIAQAKRPPLFKESTAPFWNDKHISEQMLRAHLDPGDAKASRKPGIIDASVTWIKEHFIKNRSVTLLDCGCGPGLYCQRLADNKIKVTGYDISGNSIEYARRQAERAHLLIDYYQKDYLTLDVHEQFDIILLIYCDFSVLPASKQQILLSKIYRGLKPGGVFIFDVYTFRFPKYQKEEQTWNAAVSGFWKNEPYICLHNQYHYPGDHAFVDQYIILDNNGHLDVYRMWDQYYNETRIIDILGKQPFSNIEIFGDVTGSTYSGDSETMCLVCTK